MRKGDGPAAERYASRAVAILEAAGLTDQIEYGWVASTEARILRADGKCEAAQAMFVRAASGMKAAQVAETQHDYANILADIKKGCPSL
jgi:hypothetical protein